MTYLTSAIHCCYEQYLKTLEKIAFTDDDAQYALGDVVDRDPKPMETLMDMSMRTNVIRYWEITTILRIKCLGSFNRVYLGKPEKHLGGASRTSTAIRILE